MKDVATLKAAIERQLAEPLEKISIVNLVDLFIEYAYTARASDIHIKPEEDGVRIRFRVDGLLHDIFEKVRINKFLHQEIISRIKVLSGLRTDEHLAPQDGRFRIKLEEDGNVDVRVSIMPTNFGENAILRILAEMKNFDLKDLGFSPVDLKKVERAIAKPYGMLLANGPTGSGKSTMLYTMLKRLNDPTMSIITIEDPIEYSLLGANQVQVNNQVGLTFANGLRSILRQDPNIVMVGEIRDEETANIAVNAALTGHLVLSTLHTNDAATTFPRLAEMGLPPFLIASTINIAIGQRLVRQICPTCKTERDMTESEIASLKEILPGITKSAKFYIGKGCKECGESGYLGRIRIGEVLEVDQTIRELIMNHGDATQIKEAAIKNGMVTMIQDGMAKAIQGLTTIEEVLRIINE